MKTLLIFLILCFGSALSLFAGDGNKILVYYFKNLSGEERYQSLSYSIPLYIYSRLREGDRSSRVVVIDEGGLALQAKESSVDLWNPNGLINLARKRGIDEVIYGVFYVFNGKPVIVGKVLYATGGLILDITENDTEYYMPIKEAEQRGIEGLSAGEEISQKREYSPSFTRTFGSTVVQKNRAVTASLGTLFPLGNWADVYPPGVFSEIALVFFPKVNTLPLGLGVNTNYLLLNREAGTFVESRIMAFSLGATLQYKILMKKLRKSLVLDFSTGMTMSMLDINTESYSSFDPYIKAGMSFIFATSRRLSFSVKTGIFSINYRVNPIDTLYMQVGLWGE